MIDEKNRILDSYRRREVGAKFFSYEDYAHMYRIQERYRVTLTMLQAAGYYPLRDKNILDIGCGDGVMLRQFLQWGATPKNLAGIELRADVVQIGINLTPNIDIRNGSATNLPWPAASFDLVCLHTVFTSILDVSMKQKIVGEIDRVLRSGGAILWYDFRFDNPRNPDVKGVKTNEIHQLFPKYDIKLKKITLAPPLARRTPSFLLPYLYQPLALLPFLRTHLIGILIKGTLSWT